MAFILMKEKPDAIMINVPEAYFLEKSEESFRRYYESMGNEHNPDGSFYHFISTVPIHQTAHVYVCFKGHVQYKAIIVEALKNKAPFDNWPVRNWLVTTGPIVKAPEGMVQKGFRGFRYTDKLF